MTLYAAYTSEKTHGKGLEDDWVLGLRAVFIL
jgi:hypothetical protein